MDHRFYEEYTALKRKILEKQFSRMNQQQLEAVFQIKGPLLILAGAGSGENYGTGQSGLLSGPVWQCLSQPVYASADCGRRYGFPASGCAGRAGVTGTVDCAFSRSAAAALECIGYYFLPIRRRMS